MKEYLQYILDDLFYTIMDAIALGVALGIFIKIIRWITPLKSWVAVKENAIASTIIWALILVIFGAFVIAGFFIPA